MRPCSASSNAVWTARVISPGLPVPIAWSSTSRTGVELGGGAGHEDLVGEVELGARDVALDDLEAEVAGDLDAPTCG